VAGDLNSVIADDANFSLNNGASVSDCETYNVLCTIKYNKAADGYGLCTEHFKIASMCITSL